MRRGLLVWLSAALLLLGLGRSASAILLFSGPPPSGTAGVVTTNTSGTGAGSVGVAGVLQASNGLSGLVAYTGSTPCDAGFFMVQVSPTGQSVCRLATGAPTTGSFVLTQTDSAMPNATSLGALGSGVLTQVVTDGVSRVGSVPLPAGQLAGTDAVQTFTHSGMDPRQCMSSDTDSTIDVNLDHCDGLTIANLSQPSTIQNPTGSGKPLQWLRMQICSATAQALTWGTQWSAEAGIPLPSATRGGGQCDFWLFQYNATTSHVTLLFNVTAFTHACFGVLTPGTYTSANVTVDSSGCVSAVATGGGGGGGGGAVGPLGSVQMSNGTGGMLADSGEFMYDLGAHMPVMTGAQLPQGGTVYEFQDKFGHILSLSIPARLTKNRGIQLPDEDGTPCVKGGTCFTNTTLTTPTIGKIANLTTNGFVKTSGGDGTLSVDTTTYAANPAVQTLTSSSTYTCARNGPASVAVFNQCFMAMTAAGGTITVAAPSGTPVDGDRMLFRLTCTNAQTLSPNSIFKNTLGVIFPTTCPADTTAELVVSTLYSGNLTKWLVVGSTN